MKGDLTLVDNKIRYNLNQIEKSKTEVEIEGTAIFENDLIYNRALQINVDSEDEILDFLNLNSLSLTSNISGRSNQLNLIESSVILSKNNKEFLLDLNSYFNNFESSANV